ncbi:copper-binding protein [Parasphingorhabdus sp.]|uniref:copper-binding protein n=1 Tax=Parasphingorhabdus sp. TaxID=2709688 RepID=UPI00300112B6
MRTTNYLTLLAAPLALAACSNDQETSEPAGTMMADNMPMSDDMPMMESPAAGQAGSGEGSITEIDEADGKITIDHGPIAAVGWPAMTMAFSADDESMRKVAVGDRVTFEFRTTEGGGGELTAIAKQ